MYKAIAKLLRPQDQDLFLALSDWNFVTEAAGRLCKQTAEWTGIRDREDGRLFRSTFPGFSEWREDEPTQNGPLSRSRIDRILTNSHLVDQLDGVVGCGALACCPMHRPDWAVRAGCRFQELRQTDLAEHSAVPELLLCKRAVQEVTQTMALELPRGIKADSTEDKLSTTIWFLRAIERGRSQAAHQAAERYPKLKIFVDPTGDLLHRAAGLRLVQDHAVELARGNIMSEARQLEDDRPTLPE